MVTISFLSKHFWLYIGCVFSHSNISRSNVCTRFKCKLSNMKLSKVIFVLFFAYLAAPAMGKKVAGLVVFRRVDSHIEYLMLKPSKPNKEWSPPKGKTHT